MNVTAYWMPACAGMTTVGKVVIASEAKQSMHQRDESWIASSLTLLAMTVVVWGMIQ
jgi:hypothetical protein